MVFCKSTAIFSSSFKIFLKYHSFSSSSSFIRFSPNPFSLNQSIFISPITSSSRRTMSSKPRRDAFELLMAGSRSKKQPTQESSPKESNTQEPSTPNSVNPNPVIPTSAQTKELENRKKPKLKITPDESATELKKAADEFDPQRAAFWEKGENVPFMFLAKGFDAVSQESGRNSITDIVCNMLRTVIETTPDDLLNVVYLLANKIAPTHEGVQLGVADAMIIKALAESYGTKETVIRQKYHDLGDLGLVAKGCRSSQRLMVKPEALTVAKVFDTFRNIATESGKDSQAKKRKHINKLLVAATDCEPQYLIRLLLSKLRIGLAEQTLLVALGHAAVYTEDKSLPPANMGSRLEEAAKLLKQIYSEFPVYDRIVSALLSGGVWDLPKKCSFTLGTPVGPMLAKATKSVTEILDKFQNVQFTCEYKYDGERAQIHYLDDGSVAIYSRKLENNTAKFPDVVATVSRLKKPSVTSFVLDCELVGYNREEKKILTFQDLSSRARKNVDLSKIKTRVCIYAFDILYVNGQTLLQEQLEVRRQHLYNTFEEEPGHFQFVVATTSNDVEEIRKFLDASVNSSCEGLIIKTLDRDATYEPSKRSHNWLKLKKDYIDSVGDSLDLVPIGGFHGKGKRTGVYGAFLLACYDEDKEEFQSICKVGSGFSEVKLEEYSDRLRSKVIPKPKPYYRYSDNLIPDEWFEPIEVWEVKAADLTLSNNNCAAIGIVDPDKGISLRFPRILRAREDKKPEQATSSEMVADMFRTQIQRQEKQRDVENDDDE